MTFLLLLYFTCFLVSDDNTFEAQMYLQFTIVSLLLVDRRVSCVILVDEIVHV